MFPITMSFLLALVRQVKRGGVIINEHDLTSAQTRRHVEVLRRWFDFIRLDELPRRLAQPGRRPFCLLTFDDGKRCNVTEIAPELERLGVPAVFYVTTAFLTNGTALWFDRRKALVRALPADQAEVILLRTIAGLDVAQVAEVMGRRPGTVRVLQHRGLRRLAEVFSPEVVTE